MMFEWNFFDSIEICNNDNESYSTETLKTYEKIVLDYNSDKNQFVYLISHRIGVVRLSSNDLTVSLKVPLT